MIIIPNIWKNKNMFQTTNQSWLMDVYLGTSEYVYICGNKHPSTNTLGIQICGIAGCLSPQEMDIFMN
jgi:hypothetical protein